MLPPRKLVLCTCALFLGCDDSSSDDTVTSDLTVATYNLGLLNSVGFVEQRAPLVIDAAAELDADVLCVQEVWEQKHWDALAKAQREQRPHTLRLPPDPGAQGQCDPDDFNPLQSCAEAACADADNLVACVTDSCAEEVGVLASGCTSCLLENAASADFSAIRAACVGTSEAGETGRAYVSGGSYGIGLLSAVPFAETDEKLLDASTVRRAILYARLEDPELGTVHLFCTHLTAIQDGIRYEGSYGDWEGENAAHVEALVDFVDEKAGDDGKVIVLGDLNTGPAGKDISASVPENYAKLPEAGFENAFLSGANAACTYCSENTLVVSDDAAADATIDHILTRNVEDVSVERIFDAAVEIEIPAEDGETTTRSLNLSDHYGLSAVVRL
jgi:endonuclease/exonuclease/phosphatase family metal-dependent hydrolase